MNFKTIASGSKGNCYLLETEKGSLLIEAGIPIKKIKQALNYDFSNVKACLVSHEHMDHAKAVKDVAALGINVLSSEGTFKALDCVGHRFVPMIAKQPKIIGEFEVLAFDTEHDVAEPFGYLIKYGQNKLLFATDTFYLKYKFAGLTHIVIECNYVASVVEDLVSKNHIDINRIKRTIKSHLSLENLIEFLKVNDLSKVEELHLIHLSDQTSDINIIRREIRKFYKGKLKIVGGD